jgi:hypothetical protein
MTLKKNRIFFLSSWRIIVLFSFYPVYKFFLQKIYYDLDLSPITLAQGHGTSLGPV